jgi:hypothetical protein
MNTYHMWFDLKDSRRDLELAENIRAYLDHLRTRGLIERWGLERRKFGFGPAVLGEFHATVIVNDLAQLDAAFGHVATRAGEVERLHHPVYSMVSNFTSALYRDFPDPERIADSGAGEQHADDQPEQV